jgi:hypothetical protein
MLTAVEVLPSDGETFELGRSHELFEVPLGSDAPVADYEVAANGERFLVSQPATDVAVDERRPVRSLRVVINWTAMLTDP